jgi:hypothetical protein
MGLQDGTLAQFLSVTDDVCVGAFGGKKAKKEPSQRGTACLFYAGVAAGN